MLKKTSLTLTASAIALALTVGIAQAQDGEKTKLRIQTHFATETLSGSLAAEFIEDVTVMSGGDIEIEMFYAGAVVKAAETFDAAATGILDCDMTGGAYQVGKNPAFQFAGDLNGGYSNPYQQYQWLLHAGGYEALNKLYNPNDMEFVGWWIPGPESLVSTAPIRGVEDLDGWKFRAPPGVITNIFDRLGGLLSLWTSTRSLRRWKQASSMVLMHQHLLTMLAWACTISVSTPTTRVSTQCLLITWPVAKTSGMKCQKHTSA